MGALLASCTAQPIPSRDDLYFLSLNGAPVSRDIRALPRHDKPASPVVGGVPRRHTPGQRTRQRANPRTRRGRHRTRNRNGHRRHRQRRRWSPGYGGRRSESAVRVFHSIEWKPHPAVFRDRNSRITRSANHRPSSIRSRPPDGTTADGSRSAPTECCTPQQVMPDSAAPRRTQPPLPGRFYG